MANPADSRRRARLIGLVSAVLLAVAGLAKSAHAGPEEDRALAEKLVQEGLTLARNQQFRDAIPKFEAALKLYPHPEIRHNLGRAHEEAGNLRQAHEYFTQALKEDYQFAADGRQRLMAIESELRKAFARVTVRTTPSQATVVLTLPSGEEETHVSTPFQTWVPAGASRIVGSNPAFKTVEQVLDLVAGEERAVSLVLIPVPKLGFLQVNVNMPGATITVSGRLAGKSPLSGVPWEVGAYELEVKLRGYRTHRESIVIDQDEVTSVNVGLVPEANGGDDGEGVPSWVGWTLVGTGAVAGGVALYLQFGKAHPTQDRADAVEEGNEAEYERLHQQAIDFQTAAIITGIVGAGLVGTGIYLLVAESGDASAASAPRFAPQIALTPDGGVIGGTLRF
jgi:tetratricopeptide (TPR) repeat protein